MNTREPQTFGVNERFVVHAESSQPIQPWTLLLSSDRVEALSWKIHDVRVNGRSQLDGDELSGGFFSTRQHRLPLAITSGFDTIMSGGAFELDVSLQKDARMELAPFSAVQIGEGERAPFYAALVGIEVASNLEATAYSGHVRFRTANGGLVPAARDELVSAVCDGPARVRPGDAAWFVARPTGANAFRPTHLMIAPNCQDWLIEDLHVNHKQHIWSGSISGEFFHPDALVDTFMKIETVTADRPLAIRCRYVGSNPRGGRFGALLHGDVLTDASS